MGHTCLCGGVWGIYDLVWLFSGSSDLKSVPRSKIGKFVAQARLACECCVPARLRSFIDHTRLATSSNTQIGTCNSPFRFRARPCIWWNPEPRVCWHWPCGRCLRRWAARRVRHQCQMRGFGNPTSACHSRKTASRCGRACRLSPGCAKARCGCPVKEAFWRSVSERWPRTF